jgi:hypothetical protein
LTIFFGQDPALKLVAERLAEAQKVCHQDGMYVFTCDVWYRFARIPFCFIVFYLFACIHIYIYTYTYPCNVVFLLIRFFFSNSVPLYQDRDQSSMFNPLILPTWPIHVHVISMYIWISMYRYVYVYICIYIYLYIYILTYIYTYIYTCIYIFLCA